MKKNVLPDRIGIKVYSAMCVYNLEKQFFLTLIREAAKKLRSFLWPGH